MTQGSPSELERQFGEERVEVELDAVDDEPLAEVRRRTGREARGTATGIGFRRRRPA